MESDEAIDLCREAGVAAGLPGPMVASWTGDGFECSWVIDFDDGLLTEIIVDLPPRGMAYARITSHLCWPGGDRFVSRGLFTPTETRRIAITALASLLTEARADLPADAERLTLGQRPSAPSPAPGDAPAPDTPSTSARACPPAPDRPATTP